MSAASSPSGDALTVGHIAALGRPRGIQRPSEETVEASRTCAWGEVILSGVALHTGPDVNGWHTRAIEKAGAEGRLRRTSRRTSMIPHGHVMTWSPLVCPGHGGERVMHGIPGPPATSSAENPPGAPARRAAE